MLGFDLLLTAEHDLDFSQGGALKLVSDVAQAVKIRLLAIRGEWFLDRDFGVPYFDQVFVKRPNLDHLRALYRTTILETPGIKDLRTFDLQLDTATRKMTLAWSADTDSSEISSIEEIDL